jgi:CRISPR-associated endonuclease/helicase Cas3
MMLQEGIMTFDDFFERATAMGKEKGNTPFDYQRRLAEHPWPDLLEIPTGLGKTAAVALAWIYKRCILKDKQTPRRLVYCLPMRVLVEQTQRSINSWLCNLDLLGQPGDGRVSVHLLMGGDVDRDWAMYPEASVILIGTQDMLLSRALNRGYAAGRARWPMEFGLLNNDCLWVLDEVQLMGGGLATSAQLDVFQSRIWSPMVPCRFLWMSATIAREGLETRDRQDLGCSIGKPLSLTPAERQSPEIKPRLWAEKKVQTSRSIKGKSKPPSPADILRKHQPGRLTLVVVNTVATARDWFSILKEEIKKRSKGTNGGPQPELYLLHSRFRAFDREQKMLPILEFIRQQNPITGAVDGHPGIVLVATQVIEAGFDISASRLWSEIAPWASCIQRLGRLNREGAQPGAEAFFWMPKADTKDENATGAPNAKRLGPYERADLDRAERLINQLSELLPKEQYRQALDIVLSTEESFKSLRFEPEAVVRPDDVYGLFSTEPDLAGGFTNISYFVRDQDRNADVQVFWRPFEVKRGPAPDEPPAMRDELASIPFYELRRFLGDKKSAWEWDFERGRWERRRNTEVHPGMTLLLACSQGGYSGDLGWTGDISQCPSSVNADKIAQSSLMPEALDLDPESQLDNWYSLSEHLTDVEAAMREILIYLGLLNTHEGRALMIAARWHDRGKSLGRWQQAVLDHVQRVTEKCGVFLQDRALANLHKHVEAFQLRVHRSEGTDILWAKWPDVRRVWQNSKLSTESRTILKDRLATQFRPGLRHEAASALAAWDLWGKGENELSALSVYLIASHHGKVRTVLRSTSRHDEIFGLREGDVLPASSTHLKNEAPLQFDLRQIGTSGEWLDDETFVPDQPSWTAMIAELLGTGPSGIPETFDAIPQTEPRSLGPFKLAYLEALLRAADARASRWPKGGREP